MAFRKNFPDRVEARRRRAMERNAESGPSVPNRPSPAADDYEPLENEPCSPDGAVHPEAGLVSREEIKPETIGPAPMQPSLENFGLSESSIKNLPKTWFDVETLNSQGIRTNHNIFLVYIFATTVSFFSIFDRIFISIFHMSPAISHLDLPL